MNYLLPQGLQHSLVLADGSRWVIAAGDEAAASIISQLGKAMQLRVMISSASLPPATFGTSRTGAVEPHHHGIVRRLLVLVDAHMSVSEYCVPLAPDKDGVLVCILSPCNHEDMLIVNLVRLSLVLVHEVHARGGVFLHGALAERDGIGVILAAPSGTGKTTASNRFPAPWRSLCDDTTMVVRDPQGSYWAHPWPTWSCFLDGGTGGAWDVQSAVPLKGIFFLDQAFEDRVERIGPGRAVSLLVESARQSSMFISSGLLKEEACALHLERFNNLCALAQVVPTHVLHISLTGDFWQEIEQALKVSHRKET